MILDVESALAQALASPAAQSALRAAMRDVLRELREELAPRRDDALEPLARILGCSADAARARLRRDGGLRALGVDAGSGRLLFRATEVRQYLAARGRVRPVRLAGAVARGSR